MGTPNGLGNVSGAAAMLAGAFALAAIAAAPASLEAAEQADPVATVGAAGGTLVAAEQDTDVRWLPWLGCWTASRGGTGSVWSGQSEVLCVLPAGDGVEIHTVVGDRSVSTTRLIAGGEPLRIEESGCEGWRSADWAPDGRRMYLRSELECEGGTRRTSTGIMAIAPGGEWVDVQAVETTGQTATRTLRYRQTEVPAVLEPRLGRLVHEKGLALETARLAASAPLEPTDVIEILDRAGTAAAAALLIERGDRFSLDARTLRGLADAGVPGDVIDLMVALAYPDRFTIDPIAGTAQEMSPEPFEGTPSGAYDPVRGRRGVFAGGLCPGYYDPFGRYGYFGQPVFGFYGSPLHRGFGSFGSCGFGGWGGLYGTGWRLGPVVPVVVRDGAGGRLVKGRGYTRGDSDASARPARPARPAQPSASPASSGTRPTATSRGGSSGGERSGGRRAKPRPDNDRDE